VEGPLLGGWSGLPCLGGPSGSSTFPGLPGSPARSSRHSPRASGSASGARGRSAATSTSTTWSPSRSGRATSSGISFPDGLRVKDVGDDDILDAFAALWSAERIPRGVSQSLPERPPTDRFGLRMEIVS